MPAARFLVVEDDAAYRAYLRALLEEQGYEVAEASNGLEALALVRRPPGGPSAAGPPFQVVLMDFMMEGLNGYELARSVRQEEGMRGVPLFMISGTAKDIRPLVELERVRYFDKTVPGGELMSAIREALVKPNGALPAAAPRAERAPAAAPPGPAEAGTDALEYDLLAESMSADVVMLVDQILAKAIRRKASDVHIQPQQDGLRVRFRVDGVLHHVLTLPLSLKDNVAARLKVVSSLNISERRIPQDGRFALRLDGDRYVEFRVSTLPARHGETIVLRLLPQEKVRMGLKDIFTRPRDIEHVEAALKSTTGLILLTGPTGSGKSTALYAMIEALNQSTRNIITVEDPVESEVPGVTQVPVRPGIGYTFDKVLRACLRQDPNVLMVGEVRDYETAEIALRAAMTGHLVLSTLHANHASSAMCRLANMGLKPFLISAALRLVIAQRLLRLLCPSCKREAELSREEALQLLPEERERLGKVWRAAGCGECHGIGYSGRRAVVEVMPVRSHEMHQLVMGNAHPELILAQACQEGIITLRAGALEMVARGETSFPEAMKIYHVD